MGHLLDLPAEIRIKIYSYLFEDIVIQGRHFPSLSLQPFVNPGPVLDPIPVFLVCRRLTHDPLLMQTMMSTAAIRQLTPNDEFCLHSFIKLRSLPSSPLAHLTSKILRVHLPNPSTLYRWLPKWPEQSLILGSVRRISTEIHCRCWRYFALADLPKAANNSFIVGFDQSKEFPCVEPDMIINNHLFKETIEYGDQRCAAIWCDVFHNRKVELIVKVKLEAVDESENSVLVRIAP